ncbi:uncharacterized protein MJAP1_002168 [Malassezia japonica]|uniref:CST complex subunit STN1 n=1 Tax=Malassezia japonica TaxID=223818 RepID=A0AAF0EXW8_9BASI|nr:uncharacterized protein MJAP1_002168 [Malassezia japonica]WFD39198.1 hypothetical protein MJAP1_002168 [Malassezia japonica]
MASAALFDPTLHAAYYQHRWASQKENAVLVCVRDVLRLRRAFPALFEAGAVRLYRHAQWPCVYATVVATVVAVREAEGQTEYTVDDGSAAIDVQCAPTLKKAAPGIYSCYVPADGHHDAPRLAVGDVVRVTGRVFDRRDRSRSMDVESVEVVADPTHEPAHMLEALARSDGMYRRAPDMPKECGVIEELDGGAPPAPSSTRAMVEFLQDYLAAKTSAALGPGLVRSRHLIPSFTLPGLITSASVQRAAHALVQHKLQGRALPEHALADKEHQLLSHCLDQLVRTGALLERRGTPRRFQVVCPALLGAYICALLGVSSAPFSTPEMHRRLRRADPRLKAVPLAHIDAALAHLAAHGVVAADGPVWIPL